MEPATAPQHDVALIANANLLIEYLQSGANGGNGQRDPGRARHPGAVAGSGRRHHRRPVPAGRGRWACRWCGWPTSSPRPEANALIRPEVARRLRAVPLRVHQGMVAVAMEDPGNGDTLATLDFLCRQRVMAMVATPRDIRDAIAEHYDRVEDHDVAKQLGLDPERAGPRNQPPGNGAAVARKAGGAHRHGPDRRRRGAARLRHPPAARRRRHRRALPHRRRNGAGAPPAARPAPGGHQPHQGAGAR